MQHLRSDGGLPCTEAANVVAISHRVRPKAQQDLAAAVLSELKRSS